MAQTYPLGTDKIELERLHLQHRLWSDAAHACWRHAGITPGMRVLDVGAGPGAASVDLAEIVTSSGKVLAVDASEGFMQYLGGAARERGLAQIETAVADVQDPDALMRAHPEARAGSFDLAYARWLLCFMARPEAVVRGVAALLRPGGRFCVHDYFNYESMTLAPRRPMYAKVVAATARSWREHGGDPDVVGRLPRLFDEAGLELEHLQVHQRLARPGDTMWHWAATWWRSYTPRLVTMGYITQADADTLAQELDGATRAHDFVSLPPVYEVIARKRA